MWLLIVVFSSFLRFARSLEVRTYSRLEGRPYSSPSRFQMAVTSSCTSSNLSSSESGRQRMIASLARSWSCSHFSTWTLVAAENGRRILPSSSRGVGSVAVPSTMLRSLLYFSVAFVDISETLYDSGLNSRRVIFLAVLSSAIACLFVCLRAFVLSRCSFCVWSLTMQDMAFISNLFFVVAAVVAVVAVVPLVATVEVVPLVA